MRPTNAAARAALSARAIRFYVANGLLDRPEGTGTAATYHYRHLLQLLLIKIRQREGMTLVKIKQELQEMSGDAIERRVASALAPALGAGADSVAEQNGKGDGVWYRIQVANGIEIHVREDSPASREDAMLAMREAVRAALGREDIR